MLLLMKVKEISSERFSLILTDYGAHIDQCTLIFAIKCQYVDHSGKLFLPVDH